MPTQRYMITKYSKTIHPNGFKTFMKQKRFQGFNQLYTVDRLRQSGDQRITISASLNEAKRHVIHNAYKVMKSTTDVVVKLNDGGKLKTISLK